jgi:PPOX class probable F420-dependent enzyme
VAISHAVREFLEQPLFAVMATINADSLPQQTVVWYELQGDEIMMNTARGRIKDRNLRRDPRVSVCVVDGYDAVTITGRARLVEDQVTAQADIMRLAIRYDGPESAEQQAGIFRQQTRVTIRVPIERVVVHGITEDEQ